jgi:hypothetical protein
MLSPTIRLAGPLTLALVLTGCASTGVNSYVARGVDLREHRAFNWARDDARSTGDPRLDNNRFFQERVQAAVEEQLANRGFEKTDSPDLIVRYHASMRQAIDNRRADRNDDCDECWPEVYDQGTLFIDFVDARTNRLVWRGWAKGSIDGVIDDQTWMEQRIDEAVIRIMRKLPQRLTRDPSQNGQPVPSARESPRSSRLLTDSR